MNRPETFWPFARTLCIKDFQKAPCSIKDPWGRRFPIFSNRIFCSDSITEFVNIKTWLRDSWRRKFFPGQVSKSFKCEVNNLIINSSQRLRIPVRNEHTPRCVRLSMTYQAVDIWPVFPIGFAVIDQNHLAIKQNDIATVEVAVGPAGRV